MGYGRPERQSYDAGRNALVVRCRGPGPNVHVMAIRRPEGLLEEELTRSVIRAFYEVHGELGFGFREYIYALALERVLRAKGHRVTREVAVMVHFRGEPLARQTLDMLVDERVVVESKAAERLDPNATSQLFGYLCATSL